MASIKIHIIREHNRFYKHCSRLLWRVSGSDSPIVLMVHGFKAIPGNSFELTPASFERMLRHLCGGGWHAMTQDELIKENWSTKSFYLTFDDVYDTVYTQAYPLLKGLKIPFTLFITKDLVDKPGYITLEHLKDIAKDPLCSIGGHGLQHAVFRNLSNDDAIRQFESSRQWLEDQLRVPVKTFAFPYGRIVEVSCRNRHQIKKSGYIMAFSALEGSLRAKWFTGRYFLPRINVSERFVKDFIAGQFPAFKDCEGR